MKRAVVLLSGGLDSTTALYWARSKGFRPIALSVLYGQRHARELKSARAICRGLGLELKVVRFELPWLKVSSLVNGRKNLPNIPLSRIGSQGIPSTYVPARNTVLLSLAASLADAQSASAIVMGANALDFSGYPDCRPPYLKALEKAIRMGTRSGAERKPIRIFSPLVRKTKAQIVGLARKLKVPLQLTWSCYRGGAAPCGRCDSCKLRAKGFREAGVEDPTVRNG